MSSFMNQLTKLAKSPQGKKLVDKAQQIAKDPKTKEQVEKAKLKLAELRDNATKKDTPHDEAPKADAPTADAPAAAKAEDAQTPPAA